MRLTRNLKLIWKLLRGKKHPFFEPTIELKHIHNGKVIYHAKGIAKAWNGLMDAGEQNVLDVYFRNQNAPTTFYLGLGNNGGTPGIPAENATLADITEVSGTGYARQEITRDTTGWPTLAQDSSDGDYYVTSKQVGFVNSGTSDWTSADYLFITDAASGTTGKLLVCIALSSSRVLKPSDELDAKVDQGKLS